MKSLKYIILGILGIWLFTSCEDDFEDPVLNLNNTIPPALNMSFTEYVLLDTFATDTIHFDWTHAIYDGNNLGNPTYRLLMNHDSLENEYELGSTTDSTFGITVGEFNDILLGKDFPFEEEIMLEFRLLSVLSNDAPETEIYSESVTIAFTAYEVVDTTGEPDIAKLYVPGDYQDWSPADAPNVYSPDDDGTYNGYIYFPPGGTFEFKFTSDPDWDHTNYGSGGDGVLDTDPGAGNLSVDGEGTYYMTVDTEGLTWSNELRNFALIGSFNDWAGDEPLTWDDTDMVFTITMDFDAGTEFKWRANADWAVNFGDSGAGDNTLSQDGANIVIEEAGNYTIILDLYEPVPTYEVIKN